MPLQGKKTMNNQRILALGCQRYVEDIIRSRLEKLSDGTTLTAPKSFENEMEAYIAGLDAEKEKIISLYRRKKKAKKAIKVLLIAALIAALMLLTVSSLIKPKGYNAEVHKTHTDFIFESYANENDYHYGKFNYLPEGFELIKEKIDGPGQFQYYRSDNQEIRTSNYPNKGSVMGGNTEFFEQVDITINGCPGFYYYAPGGLTITWNTGSHYHTIRVMTLNEALVENITFDESDLLPLEEMIKIAENYGPKYPKVIEKIIDFFN